MLRIAPNSMLQTLRRSVRRSSRCNQLFQFVLPLYRTLAVTDETQIVIEGFPRCANTFAVVAFNLAQPSIVRVAHHLHSVAQLRRGLELNIPTLVILRDPVDAILSLAIRNGHDDIRWACEEYVDFHDGASSLGDRLVFADFVEVTSDFGAVIRRLNRLTGSNFAVFEHTEANVAKCFELADQYEKRDAGGEAVRETHVSRPSAARQERKAALAKQIESPEVRPIIDRAQRLYAELSRKRLAQAAE